LNLSCKSEGVGTRCGPKRSAKEKSIRSLLDILEGSLGAAAGAEGMIVLITGWQRPSLMTTISRRARELLREIARAPEMTIYAGAINRDHVHMLTNRDTAAPVGFTSGAVS